MLSIQMETEVKEKHIINAPMYAYVCPLESTCWFFVADCHEFLNRESCGGFVIPVEREL